MVISGGAKCWGENIGGQLGTGDANDTTAVSEVFPAGSGITSISAGLFSTCVTKTGGIWCWGTNHAGELGWGNAASSFTPVEALPAGSGATLVAQGFANACAVVLGGTRCWGDNSFGQLGNGSTVGALSPIITLSSQSGVSQVAVGASRSCALVNGGVACWGLESRVAIIGNPSPYRKAYAATPHVDSANALDIDGSLVGAHRYSATVDGTLVLRYLRDPTLLPLPLNLAASESLRTTASDLRDYLDTVRYLLDVDGDGSYDTKVDGVLVIRYLLGFRGAALTVGIFSQSSPLSPRTTPAAIEEYLGNLTR